MIDALFWWSGAVVWSVIGLLLLWLATEVLWGAVVASSWLRFAWKAAATNGLKPFPSILKAPSIFLTRWWEFIGFRTGSISYHGKNGQWKGVGNWTVFHTEKTATDIADSTRKSE